MERSIFLMSANGELSDGLSSSISKRPKFESACVLNAFLYAVVERIFWG